MVWRCLLTLASAYLQDSSTAPRRVTRPLRSLFRGEPGFLLSYARFRRLVQLFGMISPELRQLPRDSSDTFYNSLFTCTFSPGLDWQRPSKNIEGALYKCPECLNDRIRCRPKRVVSVTSFLRIMFLSIEQLPTVCAIALSPISTLAKVGYFL